MEKKEEEDRHNVLGAKYQGDEGTELTPSEREEAINLEWEKEDEKENEITGLEREINIIKNKEKKNHNSISYLMEKIEDMEMQMKKMMEEIEKLKIEKKETSEKSDPKDKEKKREGKIKIIHRKYFIFKSESEEENKKVVKNFKGKGVEGEIEITYEENKEKKIYYILVKLKDPIKIRGNEFGGVELLGEGKNNFEKYEKKNKLEKLKLSGKEEEKK